MSRSRRRPAPPSVPISEGRHPLLDPPLKGEEERHRLMLKATHPLKGEEERHRLMLKATQALDIKPPAPTPQVLPMFPV